MSDYLPPPPAANHLGVQAGPYAYALTPMPPMRSLKGLALALTILFAVIAVADLAALAAYANRAALIGDVQDNPLSVDPQELLDADDLVATASGFHFLTVLALAVVFIIWQWRHAKNAETLGVRGGLGPGWAIGGWFIPLANFVLPGVQMFQSSKGSDVQARRTGRKAKGAGIIIAWAIVFGFGALGLSAGSDFGSTDESGFIDDADLTELESDDNNSAVGFGFMVVAAVLGIALVRTLTGRQTAAYTQLAASIPANPGPPPASTYPSTYPPATRGAPPSSPLPPPPPPPPPPTPPAPPPPGGLSPPT